MTRSVGYARKPRAFGRRRRLATVGLIEGGLLGQDGRSDEVGRSARAVRPSVGRCVRVCAEEPGLTDV